MTKAEKIVIIMFILVFIGAILYVVMSDGNESLSPNKVIETPTVIETAVPVMNETPVVIETTPIVNVTYKNPIVTPTQSNIRNYTDDLNLIKPTTTMYSNPHNVTVPDYVEKDLLQKSL